MMKAWQVPMRQQPQEKAILQIRQSCRDAMIADALLQQRRRTALQSAEMMAASGMMTTHGRHGVQRELRDGIQRLQRQALEVSLR